MSQYDATDFATKGDICLCLRELVLLEYCMQPIFCGIDAITDSYRTAKISVNMSSSTMF